MASTSKLIEKPNRHQKQQQEAAKCPRCDSSNTKFCYYNNYSLLQPRHYCKSCKRYWTKGGTLRNVPIGGACRKNKRIKRSPAGGANPNVPSIRPRMHVSSTSSNHINPSFCGLDYDLGPQMNALGLGFSSIPSTPLFSSSFTTTTPTMASLLASTRHQHKFNNLPPFGDVQLITGNIDNGAADMKDVPLIQVQVDQIGNLYDPIGWHDQINFGSSLTSLI